MTAPHLEVRGLTKRYGHRTVLDDVSCSVPAGTLVGLLGPNGSGKTTLLRVLLGLERATRGEALVNGRPLARVADPARHVGALLDCTWFHPRRTGRDHLRWMSEAAGVRRTRVDEVLELTGLADHGRDPVGSYSLGMRQRLGIAGALLGDPDVLVFDEPFNGLDHAATRWLAELVAERVAAGGIVVMSSHQLAELDPLVDRLLVLGRGRRLFDGPVGDVVAGLTSEVLVHPLTPERDHDAIRRAAETAGLLARPDADGTWTFPGATVETVSTTLADAAVPVRHIEQRGAGLSDAYERLVQGQSLPGTPVRTGGGTR